MSFAVERFVSPSLLRKCEKSIVLTDGVRFEEFAVADMTADARTLSGELVVRSVSCGNHERHEAAWVRYAAPVKAKVERSQKHGGVPVSPST